MLGLRVNPRILILIQEARTISRLTISQKVLITSLEILIKSRLIPDKRIPILLQKEMLHQSTVSLLEATIGAKVRQGLLAVEVVVLEASRVAQGEGKMI